MWSFFSKDPTKELANYEIQEPIVIDSTLQQRTIWSINNAKKKGGGNVSTAQTKDINYSAFTYALRPGNESWVKSFYI